LFPRVGFIVTNFRTSSRAVVRFYNKRGTAKQWIKEGKQAVAMTRPRQPVAATGAAGSVRQLVAHQLGITHANADQAAPVPVLSPKEA
jgi:hypothetical protein